MLSASRRRGQSSYDGRSFSQIGDDVIRADFCESPEQLNRVADHPLRNRRCGAIRLRSTGNLPELLPELWSPVVTPLH